MTKVTPQKSQSGTLAKMAKIKVQGNKEVPVVLRAIFSNYDKDGSGSISLREMNALVLDLQSLLPGTPDHLKHCSSTVTNIAISALDLDDNGTVDEDEFVEWCQQNLFLSADDRSKLMIQSADLSQFITALEICIRMQLVGIGPYSYYTPPEASFGQKYCVTCRQKALWCCFGLFILLAIFIPIFILIIYPWAQENGYISVDFKKVRPRQENMTDSVLV